MNEEKGQTDKARDMYKRALAVDPSYEDARKNLDRLGVQ